MYKVRIKSHFSSAHNLREYQGACERLHGHNWKVEAYLKSKTLDKLGMVEDFKMFKKHLNVIMDELDHEYINELEYFKTSEDDNILTNVFKTKFFIFKKSASLIILIALVKLPPEL